ncbi:hypothetical protein J3Q64DRAFT_1744304 [Phycomyces blakesleeanus]|uniref:Secreted protein n=1 Tax=Phycomyces blakesleeanus TaxID=4837 RepID=A0ABR3AZI5_PHYBL
MIYLIIIITLHAARCQNSRQYWNTHQGKMHQIKCFMKRFLNKNLLIEQFKNHHFQTSIHPFLPRFLVSILQTTPLNPMAGPVGRQ